MIATNLHAVADRVTKRAQRQGFVKPSEVREELVNAGVPDTMWKDVVALARPALRHRNGRYYYRPPVSARVRQERTHQRDIRKAVRELIGSCREAARQVERREEDRFDFLQVVKVVTEDDREHTLLSRDLSSTGIRLIGTHRLLGQKVRVIVAQPGSDTSWRFVVQILWTCNISEDLVENGGTFVDVTVGTDQTKPALSFT
ncbi:MAG: PilZ domain-containing protein [Candidatus Acidiferrum sp.]